jgi:hypothetical protein
MASRAAWVISTSLMSMTSFQSPNAWYSSIIVNSGLWRVEIPSLRKMRPISNTRSIPPTIKRLRCNSSAMRRYSCRSSVLWCVVNGRACAPPASACSTGVSTSMNPRSCRVRRKLAMISWRISNARRASGLTIRSA